MSDIVIVGNGMAAHSLTERLRHHGHRGTVTILGAEPVPAYNRVLLPSVLDGSLPERALRLSRLPESTVIGLGTVATSIDRERRLVRAADGGLHPYHHLVLATGAGPRMPDVPGLLNDRRRPAEGVAMLRTLADCRRIGGRVVVVGAGLLGVEAALALRRRGSEVTVVHRHPYPMNRQLDPPAGALVARLLKERGLRLELCRRPVEFSPGKLTLDDGRVLSADTVLVCAGIRANTQLAEGAGLAVRQGVVVDATLTTSDPRIHAIGDCAEHEGVVSTFATAAWEQAETLAGLLTGGQVRHRPSRPVSRLRAPDLDIASFGLVGPEGGADETVLLSDPARDRYARLSLRDGQLTGAVLVGHPAAAAALGPLLDRERPLPADWLAFLLGVPAEYSGPVEPPDDAVVCHCNNVTRRAVMDAWHSGARGPASLAAATLATTGCGGCSGEVLSICAFLSAAAQSGPLGAGAAR